MKWHEFLIIFSLGVLSSVIANKITMKEYKL